MNRFTIYDLRFTKILFSFLFALFLNLYSIFPIPSSLAAGASLALSPASGTVNKGCSFSVDISLNTGGAQTDGTDAIVFYDPTRLTATAIKSGTIYSDYPGNSIDASTGKITVSGLSPVGSTFSSSGILATINFTVLEAAPLGATQVKFDFDPADKGKTNDSNIVERDTVSDVLSQVTDASFTVGSGTCVGLTISPTPRGGREATGGGTIITPTPTKTIDDFTGNGKTSGSVETTVAIAVIGSILTLVGIFGLARL